MLFIITYKMSPTRKKRVLVYAKNFSEIMEVVEKNYPTWESVEYSSKLNISNTKKGESL